MSDICWFYTNTLWNTRHVVVLFPNLRFESSVILEGSKTFMV